MNLSLDAVELENILVVKVSGTFGCNRVVCEREVGLTDVELRLDTTGSDELGDLEGVGVGGDEHTRQQKGLGPKTKC